MLKFSSQELEIPEISAKTFDLRRFIHCHSSAIYAIQNAQNLMTDLRKTTDVARKDTIIDEQIAAFEVSDIMLAAATRMVRACPAFKLAPIEAALEGELSARLELFNGIVTMLSADTESTKKS